MIDISGLWDNISGQVILLLAFVGLGLLVVGLATQGFAKALLSVLGVICCIAAVIMLGSATDIRQWVVDKIFTPATPPGMIFPFREVVKHGIQLYPGI
jgi:membrane-bound ClpP family serine protease